MTTSVAIVGYGVRIPGASTPDDFWSVTSATSDQLSRLRSNVGVNQGGRVSAYGRLHGWEQFAASRFGYSDREAREIDPQQRLLLECAAEALEMGALAGDDTSYDVGVFVSVGDNGYGKERKDAESTPLSSLLGADPHYAATRISYKLGLTGPAITIGSACSSSLVAVHLAVQSILSGECDAAIAGGMDIEYPQPSTYVWADGGILSKTGEVKPFDQRADGVVFGSGGGAALLVSLDLAEELGLPIQSVIHGSAINNDGSVKASFTAPSASRQAAVMTEALATAGLMPEMISYYEAHGTATSIGDDSELRAATEAYTPAPGRIAIGSVKATIGHLRVGAGIIGLLKASEVVRRGEIAPVGAVDQPSGALGRTPFFVPMSVERIALPPEERYASVSSFGFGGTNANVVLGGYRASVAPRPDAEELADERAEGGQEPTRFRFSGATPEDAYGHAAAVLGAVANGSARAEDAAYTLDVGWPQLDYRLTFDSSPSARPFDAELLAAGLAPDDATEGWAGTTGETVLILPGQGTRLSDIARSLMKNSAFAKDLTSLWAEVSPYVGERHHLDDVMAEPQDAARTAHPLHVAIEIAIARHLRRSIRIDRYVGVSLGEFAAAVLAGALDSAEALRVAAARGELLDAASSTGDILLTTLDVDTVQAVVPSARLAIDYGARTGVRAMAIPSEDVPTATERLSQAGQAHSVKLLGLGHAYHSEYMGDIAADLPLMSPGSAPGSFHPLTREFRWDEAYWRQHLTTPSEVTADQVGEEGDLVIDMTPNGGTGQLLGSEGRLVPLFGADTDRALNDIDRAVALLWVLGGALTRPPRRGQRVSLPARPLTRERFAEQDAPSPRDVAATASGTPRRAPSIADWVYQPSWRVRRRAPMAADVRGQRWLIFSAPGAHSDRIVKRLEQAGVEVDAVALGVDVAPGDEEGIRALLAQKISVENPVDRLLHLASIAPLERAQTFEEEIAQIEAEQEIGFYSILFGTQQLARLQGARAVEVDIVSRGAHPVDDDGDRAPARALLNGPALVIPQDYPFVETRSIDVTGIPDEMLAEHVVEELLSTDKERIVALSSGRRWVRGFERDTLPKADGDAKRLRREGVYLITGGLGGIGMTIAEFLARKYGARLVLTALDSVPTDAEVSAGQVDPAHTEDEVRRLRIEQIRALEALGAKVIARACDAGDHEDMASLLAEVDSLWGGLNGVVHAAGVFETQRAFRPLSDTGRDDCERRLHPKVRATVVLDYLLRGRSLDFVLMQSSLSAHLGGLGFYAYTAGNSFMDAYVERANRQGYPSMSVNWDGWVFHERETDAEHSVIDPSFASPDFGVVAEIAIRPSEGAAIYEQLMALDDVHPVLISTADFVTRVDQWVTPRPEAVGSPVSVADPTGQAPADYEGIVRLVIDILREVTGRRNVAQSDNFFALGGDSLLGVTLALRLSEAFGVVLSVIGLFERPTAAEMAEEIQAQLLRKGV
ncbi:beta-ketoacyl synthase N-terminal-like domain-containing protein [Microbacterium sp.]|uniref:beta-ketoacyl synthase N-terminal-like domain-containing protein n=1 Tax=Microbacterium sp. TaxID=51671 RepID=UPI0039E6D97D